jgi:hypothetical protein
MRVRWWFLIALLAAASMAAGCSDSSTGPDEAQDYPSRGTPEGVIDKLALAYERQDADAYIDCLSDNFIFFLNEDDCIGNPALPEDWDRATEEQIHRTMFGPAGGIDSVSLSLSTFGPPTEIPGTEPEDPPIGWVYDEDVDLRVSVGGALPAVYVATVGARFTLQVDPDTLAARGDTLWEIRQWEDLDAFVPLTARQAISWGNLKNLFRDVD